MLDAAILDRFNGWLAEAKAHPAIAEPTAMCLATATAGGAPSARMVLLKHADAEGFVFYTNTQSRKASEFLENPHVALCFYWMPMERQVRVEGRLQQVSDEEADAYFGSRALISRIGAWASLQSQTLDSRDTLMQRVDHYRAEFGIPAENDAALDTPHIPRPPHWTGFRVAPHRIEFWQQAPFRLHDRDVYTFSDGYWQHSKLYP